MGLRTLPSPAYRLGVGSPIFRAGRVLKIEDLGVCCWVGYGEFSCLVLGWAGKVEVLVSGRGGGGHLMD